MSIVPTGMGRDPFESSEGGDRKPFLPTTDCERRTTAGPKFAEGDREPVAGDVGHFVGLDVILRNAPGAMLVL